MTAVVLALVSAALFGAMTVAVRLGLLRAPDARLGAAATTLVALLVALAALPFASGEGDAGDLLLFALAGTLGLSYVLLFEAYYRGRVSVVSPLVATETIWGVGLSALLIGRSELVGRRLLAGALLVVAGAALIGARSS